MFFYGKLDRDQKLLTSIGCSHYKRSVHSRAYTCLPQSFGLDTQDSTQKRGGLMFAEEKRRWESHFAVYREDDCLFAKVLFPVPHDLNLQIQGLRDLPCRFSSS